jgi:hypothetical protein
MVEQSRVGVEQRKVSDLLRELNVAHALGKNGLITIPLELAGHGTVSDYTFLTEVLYPHAKKAHEKGIVYRFSSSSDGKTLSLRLDEFDLKNELNLIANRLKKAGYSPKVERDHVWLETPDIWDGKTKKKLLDKVREARGTHCGHAVVLGNKNIGGEFISVVKIIVFGAV